MKKNRVVSKKKKINKKFIKLIGIAFIIITAIIISGWFFAPHVSLIGKKETVIALNEEYKEEGVKANYLGKDISKKVKIEGTVDNQKVGTYKIYYRIKKGIFEVEKVRKVKVIDNIKPEINLEGGLTVNVCPSKKYEEVGYRAIDNYDGDITDKVSIKEEEDKITYTVKDSSGNETSVTRSFIREDKEKPIITLKGESTIYVDKGGIYNEPGFTATDNCEGDMTSKVEIEGTVDTSSIGNKTITYKVIDKAKNETTITRNVYVRSPQATVPNTIYKNSMIYLTFDDGPSNITSQILDVLKKKNVKATFFVIGASDSLNYLIKREKDEGHTVALHSYTHQYDVVYKSVDNYFADLNKISDKVEGIIGERPKIIRFPGGGSNLVSVQYSKGIMTTLTNEVLARGYHYFDWNIDCNDAGGAKNKEEVYNNVVNNLSHNKTNVVLMHDFSNNYKTLEALSDIIDYGLQNGYTFAAIDMNTPLVRHRVYN